MTTLQGKVAIVTGGSREIGAAMASALARAGASVVVAHHGEAEQAEAVVSRLRAAGGQAVAVSADLSSVAENRRLVEHAAGTFGRLDIFVANAGLTTWGSFLDADEATWDTVVDLNLKGSFFGAQAAARQMVTQTDASGKPCGGRIVFSSSVTGVAALPDCSPYAITKAGLRHMATVLALELGVYGVTVNALGIGATLNARNVRDDPDYEAHWAAVTPTGRCGQPEDVADALLYLVSPEARMISGHTLMVDGGWAAVGKTP
ncbi:SDR family NAD(P)-dependent oxidoreductase [Deinococcus altitudinis]|uniref:SDR family NAD(P)-dependent oxidoreductase n=1 Tax=Deinococcus altitudinis TaxID=468914 RepID=UPI003892279E